MPPAQAWGGYKSTSPEEHLVVLPATLGEAVTRVAELFDLVGRRTVAVDKRQHLFVEVRVTHFDHQSLRMRQRSRA